MKSLLPLVFVPNYFTNRAIVCFLAVLLTCSIIFSEKVLDMEWVAFDMVAIVGFFGFINSLSKKWATVDSSAFSKYLLIVSFLLRVAWVCFSYVYFSASTGKPFEYEAADAVGYHGEALWVAGLFQDDQLQTYLKYIGDNYADMGYPTYLGALVYMFGDNVFIPRLFKALWGTITCWLIYRIARNNFGESTGRIAGIVAMLLPNLIYYCGLHVKETEMVFLVTLFAFFADQLLRSPTLKSKDIILTLFVGGSLLLFRTVLAICMLASLGVAIFFMSRKVSTIARRSGFLAIIGVCILLMFSTPIQKTILMNFKESDRNIKNQMLNYSYTYNANKFAKYGSKSIFLPLMLVAPFPSLVDTNQPNPMMLGGAFFTRNVYAFFVLAAIISMYRRRILREHIFLLSCLFSYLLVLGSSGFALSERFHMPIIPFMMVLTAYGISQLTEKSKRYYVIYLIFIAFIVIGWNWVKVAGRV